MLANPHALNTEIRTGVPWTQTDPKHTAEKIFVREIYVSPYRKPTQVDGMNILRRSSEPWLRNSAN